MSEEKFTPEQAERNRERLLNSIKPAERNAVRPDGWHSDRAAFVRVWSGGRVRSVEEVYECLRGWKVTEAEASTILAMAQVGVQPSAPEIAAMPTWAPIPAPTWRERFWNGYERAGQLWRQQPRWFRWGFIAVTALSLAWVFFLVTAVMGIGA